MKLHPGMAKAMRRWMEQPQDQELAPADVLSLLVDAEHLHRDNRQLQQRLKNAKLKQQACLEDIDYAHARGLSKKAVVLDWPPAAGVHSHQNVLLTGPTGVGRATSVRWGRRPAAKPRADPRRTSRLFDEHEARARADGTYPHLLRRLAKLRRVLILDDFGLEPHTLLGGRSAQRSCWRCSLAATSSAPPSYRRHARLEPKDFSAVIGDATLADAPHLRPARPQHRLKLGGESIHKAEFDHEQRGGEVDTSGVVAPR